MSSQFDCLNLCRLCLMKDRVQVPIFEDAGEVNQIFLKIHACLPIKLSRDDKLPKKICDDCLCKVELFYQFWNTAVDSEKQLLQWLGMEEMEDKQQGYVTEVLDPNVMKHEGSSDNRLDGNVLQVGGHQNMDLNMINNISIITMPAANEQSFSTVPMGADGTVHIAGPSTSVVHNQAGVAHLQEVDVHHEDVDNIDDGCDNDNGLTVKGEIGEDDRSMEQTYVTLSCDEAGPSGLQQQKLSDISEIAIQQSTDGEHKTGLKLKPSILKRKRDVESNLGLQTSIAIVSSEDSPGEDDDDDDDDDLGSIKDNFEEYIVPDNLYECDSCDEIYGDRSSLIIHKTERSIIRTRAALKEPAIKIKCDVCKRGFSSKGVLERHRKNCGVIDMNELPATLRQPRKSRNPPPSKDENGEEIPVQCEKCNKVFKKNKYLRVHMTMSHGEHIVCQVCNGRFDTMALLKSHVQDEHSSGFTDFCHICGKGFHLRQSLKVHLAAHTRDDNPVVCEICQKTFRHEVYLKKHVQQVHVEFKDRKKYECDHCGYETRYKTCFREHMYKHTGEGQVACKTCGKHVRKAYMRIHSRIHTGEKPEVCEYCGKSFSARKYLTKHLITHTGEKPFECRICHKKYTQRGTLTLHVRKHHPGEVTDTRPWKIKEKFEMLTTKEERVEITEEEVLMDDNNVALAVDEDNDDDDDDDDEVEMKLEEYREQEQTFDEFAQQEDDAC